MGDKNNRHLDPYDESEILPRRNPSWDPDPPDLVTFAQDAKALAGDAERLARRTGGDLVASTVVVDPEGAPVVASSEFTTPVVGSINTLPLLQEDEENNHYVSMIEMPGYNPDSITLRWLEGSLHISAEPSDELLEYYESLQEKIDFPKPIDRENIIATYKNGILKIILPITPGEGEIINVNIDIDNTSNDNHSSVEDSDP